jgi:hypothetical protein
MLGNLQVKCAIWESSRQTAMQDRFSCPKDHRSVAFELYLLFSWEILHDPGRSLPGQDGGMRNHWARSAPFIDPFGFPSIPIPIHWYLLPFLHAFVGRPVDNLSLDIMVGRRSNDHPLHIFVELPGRSLLR